MARKIGIAHRQKQTAEGEARPTIVAIAEEGEVKIYELGSETDEMDFLHGRFPIAYRRVLEEDDLGAFLEHHLKTRKDKATGEERVTQVPIEFEGLRPGDTVAMNLGGSGSYLAFAIHRQCEKLGDGARIIRCTPRTLSQARGDGNKKDDAKLLTQLAREQPSLFLPMRQVDLDQIRLQIAWRSRTDAMKARIACEQRLFQRLVGQVFVSENLAPERTLKALFLETKANDSILKELVKEEKQRIAEVEKILKKLPVYRRLFVPLRGCGPMIVTRLFVAIGDIRRFPTPAKLKSFCGVAVQPDGRFPRRRAGEVANWHPEARQALFLLGDQFNRRPETPWGEMLRRYKEQFALQHPEEINPKTGKRRYTKAHIHRMATWRTLTKFTEWLWREWTALALAMEKADNTEVA